jgi:hypothetical protein
MSKRSATATIVGYVYQFDYTIKCLLNLSNDNELIEIENIEDIDVHSCTESVAIQCKYYADTEYNHSVIAKPIRLMLSHYSDVKNDNAQPIDYKLYGFYKSGKEKLVLPITVDFLKKHFLTYSEKKIEHKQHDKLNLNDKDLAHFLSKLTIDINAEEDTAQLHGIISMLKRKFGCDDFEAEHYYYNNALKVISHMAKQSNVSNRRITKKDFINLINKKEILYNKWFFEKKGEKSYYAELRRRYFTQFNTNERFFLIEVSDSFSKSDLKELLLMLSNKWTKISRRETNPFCPYIYIHTIEEDDLVGLKIELSNDNFKFIDGYDFKGALFSQDSITQTANHNNQIKLKLIDTLDNLELVLQAKGRTQEIYQFYISVPFFDAENQYTKQVKIQVKDLQSIKEII